MKCGSCGCESLKNSECADVHAEMRMRSSRDRFPSSAIKYAISSSACYNENIIVSVEAVFSLLAVKENGLAILGVNY